MTTDLEAPLAEQPHVTSARVAARGALLCLLLFSFSSGAISSYAAMHHRSPPAAWTVGSFVAEVFLIYAWYYYDAMQHSYQRSRATNLGVACFAAGLIPYYLARSRPKGQRLKAILRMIGFAFLNLVLAIFASVVVRVAALAL